MAASAAQAALEYFAAHRESWLAMCMFINGEEKPISLRDIDLFMHDHAAEMQVAQNADGQPDLLCNDYARILRDTGGKRQCDPFNRHGKGRDVTLHGQTLYTSDAQLVFFHWALRHDLFRRAASFKTVDACGVTRRRRRHCVRTHVLPVASGTGVPIE